MVQSRRSQRKMKHHFKHLGSTQGILIQMAHSSASSNRRVTSEALTDTKCRPKSSQHRGHYNHIGVGNQLEVEANEFDKVADL